MAKKGPEKPPKKGRAAGVTLPSIRPGFQTTLVNLKTGGKWMDVTELEKLLKKHSKSKVGFVVLNAPFKVRSAETAP